MYHNISTNITEVPYTEVELQRELEKNDVIPAWSLHRLIQMVADTQLQVGSQVGIEPFYYSKRIKNKRLRIEYTSMESISVHQLQQLLKLLYIDKEIEL